MSYRNELLLSRSGMIVLILCYALLAGSQRGYAQQFAVDWAAVWGGPAIFETVKSIAMDEQYVYVTGWFSGTSDFDPGPGTDYLTAEGDLDIFFAKFTKDGKYIWAKKLGGPYEDRPEAIAIDSNGHIYLTGYFTATADFDPGPDTALLREASQSGSRDIFIARYDTAGNYVWAKSIGGNGADKGTGITVTASGNLYLTGQFYGDVDFDPGPGTALLRSPSIDIFVAAYTSNGAHLWAFSIGGRNGFNQGYSIATDPEEQVYVTGYFKDTADFDPGPGVANQVSGYGHTATFLARYDRNGNYIWARSMVTGSTGSNSGISVKTDMWGNIYLAGVFTDTMYIDPAAQTPFLVAATGPKDRAEVFVAKYNRYGDYLWAFSVGGESHDYCEEICVDASGNLYITGRFSRLADFDPGPGTAYLQGQTGYSDVFVAAYDTSGQYKWAKKISGTGGDWGMAICADTSGVYTGGHFENALSFETRPDIGTIVSAGRLDMFLIRLKCTGSSRQVEISSCSTTYEFEGEIYTGSGIYTRQYKDTDGCSNTVTLDLTLHSMEKPEIRVAGNILYVNGGYDSYQWLKNDTALPGARSDTLLITENGRYLVVVSAADGCRDTSDVLMVNNLSLHDPLQDDGIAVYPNPVNGLLHIKTPVPSRIRLMSIDGKHLLSLEHTSVIDMTPYAEGIYFLHFSDTAGRSYRFCKIIKKSR